MVPKVLTCITAVYNVYCMHDTLKSSVVQVLASYWSAPVDQSYHTTASILMMLVLDVKV